MKKFVKMNNNMNYLSLECKFDNFIPSIIITFENIIQFKNNIASVETQGVLKEFTFDYVEEFLDYVFSSNKDKLLSYYKQMGYLAIEYHGKGFNYEKKL